MQRKIVYWLTRLAVRLYCSLFTKLEVQGMENIPSHGGAILAANHRSMLDGFLLYSLAPRMASSFIKSDYFENPLLRWYLTTGGGIPVKKGGFRPSVLRETDRVFAEDGILMVFPEGRINLGDHLLSFENTFVRLAVRYQVPIVPVVIIGTEKAVWDGKWFPHATRICVIIKKPVTVGCSSHDKDSHECHAERIRTDIAETIELFSRPTTSW